MRQILSSGAVILEFKCGVLSCGAVPVELKCGLFLALITAVLELKCGRLS